MKLFKVSTWPTFVRWISFLPISILAFLVVFIIQYLTESRVPSISIFFTMAVVQIIGRPVTALVGMLIVPKGEKIIGYIYVVLFLLDLKSNIVDLMSGFHPTNAYWIGTDIGILLGTIITIVLINKESTYEILNELAGSKKQPV